MNWFKAITTVVTVIERVVDWNDERNEDKRQKAKRVRKARQVMAERYRKASNDAGKESK
jgi:uncharacterized membrane protein